MSKSRGNVQDPDELVAKYGADTVRLFLMFMGPWDQGGAWSPTGIGAMLDGRHLPVVEDFANDARMSGTGNRLNSARLSAAWRSARLQPK